MRIYFGAPLFNSMELTRNEEETKKLRASGFDVELPQELGKNSDIDFGPEAESNSKARKAIFEGDVAAMDKSDIMLAYLDGRSPDDGLCVEMGYCFGRGTPVFGISTDFRYFAKNAQYNIMVEYCCSAIFKSTEEFIEAYKRGDLNMMLAGNMRKLICQPNKL